MPSIAHPDAPKFACGVSLVSWAYNEEELIEGFLRRADALLASCVEDYEIVLVDDGSTDRTGAIVTELARELPRIRLLVNDTNRNVGYSSRRAVLAVQKEFLFWQTVDWSYDIDQLPRFLELLKTHDVVAGVRRKPVICRVRLFKPLVGVLRLLGIRHLTRRSDTLGKALVSVLNYLLIRTLFAFPLSDYQNVVFYPSKLVQSLELEADSSFANPELLLKAYWRGATIAEVPINFIPRQAGEAKGTRFRAIKASLRDIFKFWFLWVVCRRVPRRHGGRITRLDPRQWPDAAASDKPARSCPQG